MPASFRTVGHVPRQPNAKHSQQPKHQYTQSPQSHQDHAPEGDGKWTPHESLRFAVFVHYHEEVFASKRKRKLCKIFKVLADYVQTRSPTQCRSHFQKMIARHKSIARLKRHHRSLYPSYEPQLAHFKLDWEANHLPLTRLYPELAESKDQATQTEPQEQQVCGRCQGQKMYNPVLGWVQNNPDTMNNFMVWMNPNGQWPC